jgi:hypothetical protein
MSIVDNTINELAYVRTMIEAEAHVAEELAARVSHLGKDGGAAEIVLARRKLQEAAFWVGQAYGTLENYRLTQQRTEALRRKVEQALRDTEPGRMLDQRAEEAKGESDAGREGDAATDVAGTGPTADPGATAVDR